MDIFKGNKILSQNIFNSLNWGSFIIETYKERLAPFVFLYKGNEKVITLMLQETEDDFSFAIKAIKDQNLIFESAIIGYQTLIQLEAGKPSIEIIAIKGFDLHEKVGHFFAQQINLIGNQVFNKIDRPKYLGTFQIPFPQLDAQKTYPDSEIFTNVVSIKDGTKSKPIIFLGHENETEMVELYKKYILGFLKEFELKNLSGNFEVNFIPRPNIHKGFLTYLVNLATKEILISELVDKEFTRKLKPITIQVKYNEEIILNDSTEDTIQKLNEIMGELKTSTIAKNTNTKKWWQFWK